MIDVILAIALNPAVDVTYEVAAFRPGATHRVESVRVRAGGKAVNVARVLAALGRDVKVVGFAGGADGESWAAELAADGVPLRCVPVAGETRRTFAVWDRHDNDVTLLNEPGPRVEPDEWSAFRAAVADELPARALVLSGSLPPGVPDEAYAELARAATAAGDGALVVLDTDGRGFLPGVAAGPDIVKPNREELAAFAGSPVADAAAAVASAERVRSLGAGAVVASLGAEGLIAVTDAGAWVARPEPVTHGNATGAGDACVAGLVAASLDGRPWPDRLRLAAALGAAAAAAPVAGVIDTDRLDAHLAATTVQPL